MTKKKGTRLKNITFREATIEDLESIVAIEQVSFTNPWNYGSLASEILDHPWSRCVVTTVENDVAGYIIYWRLKGERHLLKMAVKPHLRRRGLGRQLIDLIVEDAQSSKTMIILEVRVSNRDAQRLYERAGFAETGIRKNYYHDNGEDALVMRYFPKR